MTSKELIEFNINQKWARARISFYEQQKETIGRLTAVLSDMPKGSRKVQDVEAESLTRLMDQVDELREQIEQEAIETENKIKEQLNLLEPKYGLLLYHYYILGNSLNYISQEILHYNKKYVYDLKKEALKEFDKHQEKKG